ncbi:hypothetical protein [Halosegnis marinus]|uniref:hypothetical protein n=1 Tax=Halosegnis marinus TaxID=3034023 RepID=UPI0036150000
MATHGPGAVRDTVDRRVVDDDELPESHRRTSTATSSARIAAASTAVSVFSGYTSPNPRCAMSRILPDYHIRESK